MTIRPILFLGVLWTCALPAKALAGDDAGSDDFTVPAERFGDAQQSFTMVKDTLLKKYFRANITEEDLYRAAVQGMLHYVDPKMRAWNKLMSPSEIRELHNDMRGEMVGVGVEIRFEEGSGISDVLGIIPGSPAEKAGIAEGDKILAVNGKMYKGKGLREVVSDIRGKAGETVKLTLLRGAEVTTRQVRRERVVYEQVSHLLLPGGVGYVQISSFSETTVPALRAALGKLTAAHVRALVIDLRGNQGGLFDKAVESAGFFLPRGRTIVRIVRRGDKEEAITNQQDPLVSGLPVALLVNGDTASGGEFFTAALREGLSAQVVGRKTLGKWSVQELDDLPNQYAIKFTTSLFRSPSGKSYEGQGLPPDVQVDMDEKQLGRTQHVADADKRLAGDVQLRTAVNLLRR